MKPEHKLMQLITKFRNLALFSFKIKLEFFKIFLDWLFGHGGSR